MPIILPSSLPLHLHELALFAGAGGGILGGKLLGWRTVCAVEWDAYARDVLVARQNDGCLEAFPIWDDVQTFDGAPWRGSVDVVSGGFPCQDISAAGKGAGIEGERSGMWKHMARIIGEVLPRFVFVENSPMLVGRGLAVVLADLAEMGYDAAWGIVGAHHAGAPHKRDRIWVLGRNANSHHVMPVGEVCRREDSSACRVSKKMANSTGTQNHAQRGDCECGRNAMGRNQEAAQQDHRAPDNELPCGCSGDVANATGKQWEWRGTSGTKRGSKSANSSTNVAYSSSQGIWTDSRSVGDSQRETQGKGESSTKISKRCGDDVSNAGGERGQLSTERELAAVEQPWSDSEARSSGGIAGEWWATEPDVGRVAHGVAARVDRLRCLGNGQVPRVVPLAWKHLES